MEDIWMIDDLNELIGMKIQMKFEGTGGEEEEWMEDACVLPKKL